MKTLNNLAKNLFGEFGFTTLTEEEQEYIINKYYKLKTLHEVLKTK
tara:strand:- start:727 stop:864 length:138 start_codon:yes stop_codon:yes gene_type:complete